MKKNESDQINRMAFIQLCVEQPQEGEKYLTEIAKHIGQSKKTSDIIGHLSELLFLSECTIYRDLEKY